MVAETPKEGLPIVEYQIPKWKYYVAEIPGRGIPLAIGIYLTYFILYKQCMYSYTNCNPIVTVFFALLALACFNAVGFPIDKIMNIKLT